MTQPADDAQSQAEIQAHLDEAYRQASSANRWSRVAYILATIQFVFQILPYIIAALIFVAIVVLLLLG
ncbi:hypothetical protein [Kineosporia succinea]|uniref:Uncharacterized protein n=1 Tax=Kineosporia succinea TaxID=84632 RepID=A0ABT9P9P9_9ACTN|nr:hypothetical protein [Kineosporia succinea]MDP9829417.1 hypothetical protein [Kineosporia succinea]